MLAAFAPLTYQNDLWVFSKFTHSFTLEQVKPGFTNYQPRGLLILNFTILKKNIQNISKSFRQNQTIKNKVNK